MPDNEQDSWLGVLGIDVDQIQAKVQGVVQEVQTTVESGIDTVVHGATNLYRKAEDTLGRVGQAIEDGGAALVNGTAPAPPGGANSGPIAPDCRPVHGFVSGPAEHLLCQTHGHVLDVRAGQIIAGSLDEYRQLSASGMLGKVIDAAQAVGPAGAINAGIALVGDVVSNDQPTPLTGDAGTQGGDAGDGGAKDAGAGDAGDSGSGEVPDFRPTSPVPFDVRADTADDFVSNANAAMGGGGAVGHMQPKVNWNLETGADGRVTKVNMVLETTIVRPRFAGGRPSDAERAVINQAELLIKTHEEKHRDIARDFATRAVKAALGKSPDDAEKTLNKLMNDMDAAQAAFDHREGMIVVLHDTPAGKAGPATGVRSVPAP
jgi:hypothetical protein